MSEIQSTAAGRGHVRAVFSPRCKGHVAPLDLIRAHLRVVEMRGRVRAAFADYLVTDADDEALRALELVPAPNLVESPKIWRSIIDGRVVGLSSGMAVTGFLFKIDRDEVGVGDAGGPLDAPDFIAVGGCKKHISDGVGVCCEPMQVRRDGVWW